MRAKSGGARYRREAALKRLLDRRQEIADKLLGLRELPLPEAAASKDADDHAVDELAREMEFALAQMRSATLQRIDEAIRRLRNGTYGLCTDCGADIPATRLKALPFASLCRYCQSEREWLERERSPVEAAAESHCHAL
jgi:DnaK suppressor protein